ncbi:hypothetical protein GE061_008753 [Apolygus lucorum]|uniref:Uncharacterized protein n=1 Tax=Apolygus lucorum TaxID=248454 RepID=A0A8S9WLV0_APOLU|nr:hypothetical protein GE061_008753 [Apolygus lucorum]
MLLASLDGDVAELISDLLLKPLSNTPYTDLMIRLQTEFEISEGRKVSKLLTELDLGDRKPSQLLREMRSLAEVRFKTTFSKQCFFKRLPVHIRAILASSSDPLDNWRSWQIKYLNCLLVNILSMQLVALTFRQIVFDRLEAQIAQLTSSVAALNQSNRSRSGGGIHRQTALALKTPKPASSDASICRSINVTELMLVDASCRVLSNLL